MILANSDWSLHRVILLLAEDRRVHSVLGFPRLVVEADCSDNTVAVDLDNTPAEMELSIGLAADLGHKKDPLVGTEAEGAVVED